MRKPKLTHEELSRVLSQAAIGLLDHTVVGCSSEDPWLAECGCVAGAAYAIGGASWDELDERSHTRLWNISDALGDHFSENGGGNDYGGDPDSVLRTLEAAGLA